MTNHNEADHPRSLSGEWTEKRQSAPELALTPTVDVQFPTGARTLTHQDCESVLDGLSTAFAHIEAGITQFPAVRDYASDDSPAGTVVCVSRSAELGIVVHFADGSGVDRNRVREPLTEHQALGIWNHLVEAMDQEPDRDSLVGAGVLFEVDMSDVDGD